MNKLQIKLLWVFTNYNKMLGSIKNKKFLNLSDPLIIPILDLNFEAWRCGDGEYSIAKGLGMLPLRDGSITDLTLRITTRTKGVRWWDWAR